MSKSLLLCALVALSSTLAAQTWQQQGTLPRFPIAADVDGQSITVITERNLYTSDDGGSTWRQRLSPANAPFLDPANGDFGLDDFQGISGARSAVFGRTVFMAASPPTGSNGANYVVYATTDGGETLTEVFRVEDAYGRTDFGYDLAFADAGNGVFAAIFQRNASFSPTAVGSSVLYLSTNGGKRFARVGDAFPRYLEYAGRTTVSGQAQPALAFHATDADGAVTLVSQSGQVLPKLGGPSVETDATYVDGNTVVQAAFDLPPSQGAGNPVVTLYSSTDGGATYTSTQRDFGTNVVDVDFVGADLYVSAGASRFNSQRYRLAAPDYTIGQPLTDVGYLQNVELRRTADGRIINAERAYQATSTNLPDDYVEPAAFRLYDVNAAMSYTPLPVPPYSLAALPEHDGRYLSVERGRGDAYSTTDGVNWRLAFKTSNFASGREYFTDVTSVDSYSDPSTSVYLTDDARTAANGEQRNGFTDYPSVDYWSGQGKTLYTYQPRRIGNQSSFTQELTYTTDAGRTSVTLDEEHYLWTQRTIVGDPITGDFYGLKGFNGPRALSVSQDTGRSWRLVEGSAVPPAQNFDGESPFRRRYYPPFFAYGGRLFVFDGETLQYSVNGGRTFETATVPFSLNGAQVYRLGDKIGVRTYDERYFATDIAAWLPAGVLPQGVQADLELSIRLVPADPKPFTAYEAIVTVTNKGAVAATEVFVSDPSCPTGCIRQGGRDPIGDLSTIPAGESRSKTFYYFRQDGDVQRPYAQIVNQFEPDSDSRPGNGVFGDPQEDDEALYNPNAVLPVEIISQRAVTNPDDCGVEVSWTVGTEDGTAAYLVQSASEQDAWQTVATIPAVGASDYQATVNAAGQYLRIVDVDADGTRDNGAVMVSAPCGKTATALRVSPNPVSATQQLRVSHVGEGVRARLYDVTGRVAREFFGRGTSAMVDVGGLASGLYVLRAGGESVRVVVR